jgi:hypothetical protein
MPKAIKQPTPKAVSHAVSLLLIVVKCDSYESKELPKKGDGGIPLPLLFSLGA